MPGKKILLVDDEQFIRELYERVLKQAGFEILTAADGQEGWLLIDKEAHSSQKPDLILLDIMMPKLNGIEVLKKVRSDSNAKNIPVILLTNLGQEQIIKEAFRLGASGYLMKIRTSPYEVVKVVNDFLVNPTSKPNIEGLNLD